jgi:hypothetical protein
VHAEGSGFGACGPHRQRVPVAADDGHLVLEHGHGGEQAQLLPAGFGQLAPQRFDGAAARIPLPTETGNLIVDLPGTRPGPRLLFSTHMDTVPLCSGAKPRREGDRIVVDPTGGEPRRGDRVVVKTTAGEVLAKEVARITGKAVELKSLNPDYPGRTLERKDVAWIARILWASQ